MTELNGAEYNAVFFDLDGTLVDTAPDMVAVLHRMQHERGIDPLPYDLGRANISNGSVRLLALGFPNVEVNYDDDLHQEFLERYSESLCIDTRLFEGMNELLQQLEELGCPWGVVTNKPEKLTMPLLGELELSDRMACAVSGDTLSVCKPDPAQLLLACDLIGVEPETCIYVGDAERDIEAGQRAGMATIAASYGYITEDDDPREWDADVIATTTEELTQIVIKAVNLEV